MFVQIEKSQQQLVLDEKYVSPTSILSTHWLLYCLTQTKTFACGRILDVGCGRKPYQTFFPHTEYIGIDWPHNLHDSRPEAYADAQYVPFAAATFDTVICTEVIEHLPDPSLAIRNIACILRPGGHLILSAPFVHVLHEEPFDFFRFTPIGLQHLVKGAGFEVVNTWARGGVLSVLVSLWGRYLMGFLRRFLNRLPRRFESLFVTPLIRWPQRLAAYWLINHRRWGGALFDPSQSLSLGYVLVARRIAD